MNFSHIIKVAYSIVCYEIKNMLELYISYSIVRQFDLNSYKVLYLNCWCAPDNDNYDNQQLKNYWIHSEEIL